MYYHQNFNNTSLSFYLRLPQDIYQTAKVAKVLLLMEKGRGDQFRGKNLNEIEIDNEVYYSSESEHDEEHAQEVLNKVQSEEASSPVGDKIPYQVAESVSSLAHESVNNIQGMFANAMGMKSDVHERENEEALVADPKTVGRKLKGR